MPPRGPDAKIYAYGSGARKLSYFIFHYVFLCFVLYGKYIYRIALERTSVSYVRAGYMKDIYSFIIFILSPLFLY